MDAKDAPGRIDRLERVDRSAEQSILRLRKPRDLVEAVPYLLGFHPRSSVVLVGLAPSRGVTGLGRVTITARLDIADLVDVASPRAGTACAAATQAAQGVTGSGATGVVGVVFTEAGDEPEDCVRAMACAGRACEEAGLEVADWFVASARHEQAAAPGLIATQATYAGLVARPDRESMVELLQPAAQAERERLRDDLERSCNARRQAIRAGRGQRYQRGSVRALFAASRALMLADDAQVVRFGAALDDIRVRDACWLGVEGGRLDGENLWRELARRLPRPYDAAPLFLFGWVRWRAGDGALAGIAARMALDSDPDYRAAALLDGALRQGLDPFRTPRLRKGA